MMVVEAQQAPNARGKAARASLSANHFSRLRLVPSRQRRPHPIDGEPLTATTTTARKERTHALRFVASEAYASSRDAAESGTVDAAGDVRLGLYEREYGC